MEIISQFKNDIKTGINKVAYTVIDTIKNTLEKSKSTDLIRFGKKIAEDAKDLISKETKEGILDSINKIIEHTKEGLKKFGKKEFGYGFDKFKSAGKEALECIDKLFGAIKDGIKNGFDKVKNNVNTMYNKLESLAKINVLVRS